MNATTNNTGRLATIQKNTVCAVPELRGLFTAQLPELERMYPESHKTAAARLARAVITEVQKNPQLATCTGLSLLSCAVQAATLNLEIGGPTGQSYMVPYKNNGVQEATFQLGYRGLITLAYRSGKVGSVTAQVVRQGDHFKVKKGTNPGIEHEDGEGGSVRPAIAYYAVVQYRHGGIDFEVMSVPEVDEHRKRFSKQGNQGGNRAGIWAQHFDAMALKTVLRKVLKRCPIGVDLNAADTPEPTFAVDVPPMEEEPRAALPPIDNGIDEPHGDAYEGEQQP